MITIGPEHKYHRELLAACDRIRAIMETQRHTPGGKQFFAVIARCEAEAKARRVAEKATQARRNSALERAAN